MRRLWVVVCFWMLCKSVGGLLLHQVSHGQQTASIPPSVIRLEPLAGQVESPVVTAMAISPGPTGIAVAGDDHSIRLLDPIDGRSIATQVVHRGWVRSLAFSPGGRRLASCGHDGEVRVWEVSAQAKTLQLLTHHTAQHAIFGVAFASENELYAVGFSDAVYRLNLTTDDWRVDHRCDCKDLRAIDISRDGRWMAYGGRDGIIRFLGLVRSEHLLTSGAPPTSAGGLRLSPHLHYERILSIRFADDGKTVFSCGEDRRLVQWEPSSNRMVAGMDVQAGKLMATCPLENGRVAVSGSDNTIRIVDLQASKLIAKLVGHDGSVAVLQRTADHLISSGFDTTIRTWNIEEAMHRLDDAGRFIHPISAQFEDSSSQDPIR